MGSYAHGAVGTPLLGETIGANLERTVAAHRDRDAFVSVHQGVRYTYGEFDAAVDDLAIGLMRLGLARGDRVGIWGPNHVEWALVQYATAKIGVVLVNVNPAYRTHELTYALRQSGCRVLIAAPAFRTSDYVDMVASVRADLPALERAVFFWSDEWDALRAGGTAAERDALRARASTLQCDPLRGRREGLSATGLDQPDPPPRLTDHSRGRPRAVARRSNGTFTVSAVWPAEIEHRPHRSLPDSGT